MGAVADAVVSSSVGVDGNTYTTAVSNDKLTNDDFLKLLLEQMKQQDPTKPQDTTAIMDSQLKMSTIQSNSDMSTAMASLQAAYGNSALSTAANLVGRFVEDGSVDADGVTKSYKVQTVENVDGELYVNAVAGTGYVDTLYNTVDKTYMKYDTNGYILDSDGKSTGIQVKMEDGRFVTDSSGNITLLDADGKTITDATTIAKYVTDGAVAQYADTASKILVSSIDRIW
ncbi:MAG: flagellar hook capping FlgD N-terminal domain-containing protein [Arcobacteraceae bacterium]|nr:flagellar hook capping FlgD N-terminal domain-containing protein [Arcobacteraceae bacterium]